MKTPLKASCLPILVPILPGSQVLIRDHCSQIWLWEDKFTTMLLHPAAYSRALSRSAH
jgi:hypothetical protein